MSQEDAATLQCPHCHQLVTWRIEMEITPYHAPKPQRHSYIDSSGNVAFTPPTVPGDAHG